MGNSPKLPPLHVVETIRKDMTRAGTPISHARAIATRTSPNQYGLTEKQEAFALLVAEGYNYSQAYRAAYNSDNMKDPTIWHNASMLAQNKQVAQRIEQLQAEKAKEQRVRAATRAGRVLETLEEILVSGQTDAHKLKAAELLGKTVGLYIDRQEIKDTSDNSLEELEKQLADLLDSNRKHAT